MFKDLDAFTHDNSEPGEYERTGEVIERVEFTLEVPQAATVISCKDPEGFDQTPVPVLTPASENYGIATITVNGVERPEAYWREYSTLIYYDNIKMEAGKTYSVFGKVKAAPGYIFNDPVELYINGEEVYSEEIEDYSLEGDSFTFYFDVTIA